MLKLKPGVSLKDLTPQMSLGAQIVTAVFDTYGLDAVITSGNDSFHMPQSKHYMGNALDFRMKHIARVATKSMVLSEVRDGLGRDFDVVHESKGLENEHLHVEYDPDV